VGGSAIVGGRVAIQRRDEAVCEERKPELFIPYARGAAIHMLSCVKVVGKRRWRRAVDVSSCRLSLSSATRGKVEACPMLVSRRARQNMQSSAEER
jgi:hypothetical protein